MNELLEAIVILTLLSIIGLCLHTIFNVYFYWKEYGVPSSMPFPFFGEYAHIIFKRLPVPLNIQRMYNIIGNKRYYGFHQCLQPVLMLKDPELISEMLVKNCDHFPDHRHTVDAPEDIFFGKHLLLLRGDKWRTMRNTLNPILTNHKIKDMFQNILECANDFNDSLVENDEKIVELEMHNMFSRLTNDIITTTTFGIKLNTLQDSENEFYMKGRIDLKGSKTFKLSAYTHLPFIMNFLKIKLVPDEVGQFFSKIVNKAITIRETEKSVNCDVLNLMLEAKNKLLTKDEDLNVGFASVPEIRLEGAKTMPLTNEEIIAQCLVFFNSGYDTLPTTLSYAAYELALNPDVQEKLHSEIDHIFKIKNGKLTYESLMDMKYLDMFISEVLRKWPPIAMIDRLCVKDYKIVPKTEGEKGAIIKEDVVVLVPVYAIHRDPQHYPEPDTFDPERFSEINRKSIKPFTYMPFGFGQRNCIGSKLALLEMKTVIISLLSKFKILKTEKTQIPLKFTQKHYNMLPEKGYHLRLSLRNNIKS